MNLAIPCEAYLSIYRLVNAVDEAVALKGWVCGCKRPRAKADDTTPAVPNFEA